MNESKAFTPFAQRVYSNVLEISLSLPGLMYAYLLTKVDIHAIIKSDIGSKQVGIRDNV